MKYYIIGKTSSQISEDHWEVETRVLEVMPFTPVRDLITFVKTHKLVNVSFVIEEEKKVSAPDTRNIFQKNTEGPLCACGHSRFSHERNLTDDPGACNEIGCSCKYYIIAHPG